MKKLGIILFCILPIVPFIFWDYLSKHEIFSIIVIILWIPITIIATAIMKSSLKTK